MRYCSPSGSKAFTGDWFRSLSESSAHMEPNLLEHTNGPVESSGGRSGVAAFRTLGGPPSDQNGWLTQPLIRPSGNGRGTTFVLRLYPPCPRQFRYFLDVGKRSARFVRRSRKTRCSPSLAPPLVSARRPNWGESKKGRRALPMRDGCAGGEAIWRDSVRGRCRNRVACVS